MWLARALSSLVLSNYLLDFMVLFKPGTYWNLTVTDRDPFDRKLHLHKTTFDKFHHASHHLGLFAVMRGF